MKLSLFALTFFIVTPWASAKLVNCRGPVDASFTYKTCGPDHYCRILASCADEKNPKDRKDLAIFVCKSVMVKGLEMCPEAQACVDESEKILKTAEYEKN